MNQKSFVIAALLAATAFCHSNTFGICSRYQLDPNRSNVHQKNTGSGESTNFNCGENLIKAGAEEQEYEFED